MSALDLMGSVLPTKDKMTFEEIVQCSIPEFKMSSLHSHVLNILFSKGHRDITFFNHRERETLSDLVREGFLTIAVEKDRAIPKKLCMLTPKGYRYSFNQCVDTRSTKKQTIVSLVKELNNLS